MTRLLAIDHGRVRIGLAVTDTDRRMAFPLSTYECRDEDRDAAYFRELMKEQEVEKIILGLPLHTDGREGRAANEVREFAEWLHEVTGLPIVFFDERFSTRQAERHLWSAGLSHKQRKARRDRVAAQIILQSYLEAGCPET